MSKKKIIKPTFYYDEKKRPVLVRFSVEDYNSFYRELKKLSAYAKALADRSAAAKKRAGKKILTASGIARRRRPK